MANIWLAGKRHTYVRGRARLGVMTTIRGRTNQEAAIAAISSYTAARYAQTLPQSRVVSSRIVACSRHCSRILLDTDYRLSPEGL